MPSSLVRFKYRMLRVGGEAAHLRDCKCDVTASVGRQVEQHSDNRRVPKCDKRLMAPWSRGLESFDYTFIRVTREKRKECTSQASAVPGMSVVFGEYQQQEYTS